MIASHIRIPDAIGTNTKLIKPPNKQRDAAMTKLNVSDVAQQFAETFQRDHRTIYTHDAERVDLHELAFTFQQCIDEFVATNTNGTNVQSCPKCEDKAGHHLVGSPSRPSEEHLGHVPCVIARYKLTDEEWDRTPERLQAALLLECA
jgi:hypothetical protein